MVNIDWRGVAVLVGAAALLAWYGKNKAVAAAQAVNPVNNNNVINQGVSTIVQDATGGHALSLGDWLFSLTHPGQ